MLENDRMMKTATMEVKPFKAFRFDAKVVGDVGRCIAPPYDVISDDEQERLYGKSEYNIVRIIKGKLTPSDDGQDNQYTRAARYLREWMEQGALKEDDQEAIYGYVQDFELNGTAFQRFSFVALAKLEDFGKMVKPHEQVFEKPMLDRLSLKKATTARFGLVFMLYEDPQRIAEEIIRRAGQQDPLVDFTDEQNVRHRLFAVTAEDDINAIVEMMSDKSCIIADGHHRYTTGLTYLRETGNPAAGHQMLAFTNMLQDGLVVLATHRLVSNVEQFEPAAFIGRLERDFDIQEYPFAGDANAKDRARELMLARMRDVHDEDRTALGIYMGGTSFYTAVLKNRQLMDASAPTMSPAWRALDVAVLQKLVLEDILGIDDAKMRTGAYVTYVKDTPTAVADSIGHVDAGREQIAFFTNPVKMQQLVEVTQTGERMPQKSTYFYPKMYTGLTIQKL